MDSECVCVVGGWRKKYFGPAFKHDGLFAGTGAEGEGAERIGLYGKRHRLVGQCPRRHPRTIKRSSNAEWSTYALVLEASEHLVQAFMAELVQEPLAAIADMTTRRDETTHTTAQLSTQHDRSAGVGEMKTRWGAYM
jgi:hypothetical protein